MAFITADSIWNMRGTNTPNEYQPKNYSGQVGSKEGFRRLQSASMLYSW